MKKSLSLLLSAALVLALAAGCKPSTPATSSGSHPGASSSTDISSGSTSKPDVSTPVSTADAKITVLSGPTGIGAAKMMSDANPDWEFNVVAANDEVVAALTAGQTDIAAIATNVAANLSAKTNGNIKVLSINTLGVLYILDKNVGVTSMADLKGQTIYATGQGANPEYVLNHLLTANNLDPAADVTIEWMTGPEVVAKMVSADAGVCMLPVPAATGLLMQDSAVKQAISLTDEWEDKGDGSLAMGCVVARTEFIEEHPEVVEAFLAEYEESINFMKDEINLEAASQMVAEFGITANEKVAAKAIPQCNLAYITGTEMKTILESYYAMLFQANPAAIGGAMPYDSFYYGVE